MGIESAHLCNTDYCTYIVAIRRFYLTPAQALFPDLNNLYYKLIKVPHNFDHWEIYWVAYWK